MFTDGQQPLLLGYDACHFLGFFLYGVDRHAWEVTADQAVKVRIVTWGISMGYMLITSLVKISILMFYRRLSEGSVTRSWVWTVRVFIAFVILYGIVFTLMLFVDCRPMHAFWYRMDPAWAATNDHTCIDEGADFIASAVISVVTDAAVCILPLLVVRRLQMPRKQKWALGALFAVGFFLCFCGIMRIVYIYEIYYTTYDTTWAATTVWSWTLVETHFAVICASAPALKLFVRRYLQSTHGHGSSYTTATPQRNDYSNFGSSAELGAMKPGRSKDVDDGDGEAIYMADMLAFDKAAADDDAHARAEADRRRAGRKTSKGLLPLFSTTTAGGDASLKSSVSVMVTGEEERGRALSGSSGDAHGVGEARSTRSMVRSRGSTDSILETRART
ncbi:hypothetical protein SLS58_001667 [Diplodia intermedia]|uniref:Rhodopsin domain-containing protein n=1 Tax=Diplodia intermedia TaxID=856260 RepID=A0ABR3U1R5_9PEZI